MNKESIIKCREIINNELSDSLKELGTDWYHRLALIRGELDVLISILENPEKNEKARRMFI